jgi:hypothetical protein
MKKNYRDKVTRKAFIQLAIDNPKIGSRVLAKKTRELSKCKNTAQVVKILAETLHVTERTIYNDYCS